MFRTILAAGVVSCLGLLSLTAADQADQNEPIVIVYFGDSTTACTYLPAEQRPDAVLNKLLAARYPNQKIVNINQGLDGEFIRQLLDGGKTLGNETVPSRYKEKVLPRVKHIDIAILRYGQNDYKLEDKEHKDLAPDGYSPQKFKDDYRRLIETLRKDYPGVHIMLETGTYFPKDTAAYMNQLSGKYWNAVRELAVSMKLPLIDSNRADEQHPEKVKMFNAGHPAAEGVVNHEDTALAVIAAKWPQKLPHAGEDMGTTSAPGPASKPASKPAK